MKKKLIILLAAITICTVVSGEEFQEITPFEQNISVQTEIAEGKSKKVESIEEVVKKEKNSVIEETKERILDLGLKRKGAKGLVYAGDETVPYTGKFALFLGDIIEYTETYKDGILNGPKTWYSYDGVVVLQENYIDNKIEGEQKAYYNDGKIKSIVTYKNGKIMNIEALAKTGEVLYKDDFSKGNGLWRYFWENGNILEEGEYKNWKKDGVWKKYRENGEIDVVTTYKNGKLISQVWN